MTKEQAAQFFSELYFGPHHIPSEILQWGHGWCVKCTQDRMHTFDYNHLTRFVLMCHEYCIRGEVKAHTFNSLRIIIHQREKREGKMHERHPTIEQAITQYREYENPYKLQNQ